MTMRPSETLVADGNGYVESGILDAEDYLRHFKPPDNAGGDYIIFHESDGPVEAQAIKATKLPEINPIGRQGTDGTDVGRSAVDASADLLIDNYLG